MKFHSCVNIMNVLIDALGTLASFTFPMTRINLNISRGNIVEIL